MKAKQEIFINGLLSGRNVKRSAQDACISERQAHRWLSEPEIKQELSRRQSRISEEIHAGLLAGAQESVSLLCGFVRDDYLNDELRRQAARDLLNAYFKHTDIIDFERRLSALEAKQ